MKHVTFIAAAGALLAGCGGARHTAPPTTTSVAATKWKSVHIYFTPGATHRQEQSARTRLEDMACVRRVVFVSKVEALREMKRKLPELFKGPTAIHGNPLPDELEIAPARPSCATSIAATARAAGWPAIHSIVLGRKPLTR